MMTIDTALIIVPAKAAAPTTAYNPSSKVQKLSYFRAYFG